MVFLSLFVQIILLKQSEPSFKKAGYMNYLETWPVVERHRCKISLSCAPFCLFLDPLKRKESQEEIRI